MHTALARTCSLLEIRVGRRGRARGSVEGLWGWEKGKRGCPEKGGETHLGSDPEEGGGETETGGGEECGGGEVKGEEDGVPEEVLRRGGVSC